VPALLLILALPAVAGETQEAPKRAEPPAPVQVKGRVVDRNGNGLANIEVTIEGLKPPVIKKTGSTGAFNFDVPPGKYKITAKAGGKTAALEADVAKAMELPPLVLNIEE
jgi:hypothetical protein